MKLEALQRPIVSQPATAQADPLSARWWVKLLPGRLRRWLLDRFGDATPTVRRGYGLWLTVGAVIAVPEIWAAAAQPPWPTISGTVGHLEERWNVIAVIVVALLVGVAAWAVRFPLRPGVVVTQADGATLARTADGRVTTAPGVTSEFSPLFLLYGPAVICVAGGLIAASITDDKWTLGYVIYGLIFFFFGVVPSVLAHRATPNAPFSGLFPTLADLQRRLHVTGVVLLAGLVILLIHLAFYPWPDVFRHHPSIGSP